MTFVRVRLPNGHETSLNEDFARSEELTILDEPATDYRGRPLPETRKKGRRLKPRVSVNEAAAASAATRWLQSQTGNPPQGVPVADTTATTGGDAEGGTSE